jgi:hypothetical protein
MMDTYQHLRLDEWIEAGRATGAIRDANTVILAYCMDDREAMAWIADIVIGRISEQEALVFMERAIQYNAPSREGLLSYRDQGRLSAAVAWLH